MTDTTITEPKPEPLLVGAMVLPKNAMFLNEHPQLDVPFAIRIGGRRLEGKSLSITDAYASGLMPPNGQMERTQIGLQFDFEGFTLSMFLLADIEKIGESENPSYHFQFCEPSGTHLAPLRHIINSHLAGDLVTMDRILGYTGPKSAKSNNTQVPSPTLAKRTGQFLRSTAIVGLSLGLFVIAGNIVHDRVVFSYEPRPVIFQDGGETLRATSAGQITYTNDAAREGDVVYSIATNSGNLLSVRMPCDCSMSPLPEFYQGATILAGTPLVQLIDDHAGLEANTSISPEGATHLLSGDTPQLEMPDGRVFDIKLNIMSSVAQDQANALIPAEISFISDDLTQFEAGDTARLRFRRNILPDAISASVNQMLSNVKGMFLGA